MKEIGRKLFSFAVVADTHMTDGDDISSSPFAVNKKANARFRYVVDDLNQRELSFVVHLGDIVHPVPSMGVQYADSAARFFEQVEYLAHPIFIVPSNHDVGDKPMEWGPAGTVRQGFLDAWAEHFGAHYFVHELEGVVCLGINAQVLGSGLPLETEQAQWLETTLAQHRGSRIFLFSHYPPFLLSPDEGEHYDNMGLPGRAYLLQLLKTYRVEGLFAGHVHHFWYNRYDRCDCYLLPSVCFTRQDYSEMFRIGPAAEYGRDDADKLGYMVLHVHEHRHLIEMVRCYGRESKAHQSRFESSSRAERLPTVNAISNRHPVLGFDLRHDWCERLQFPPSGGLDEFDRKWVRNDYALLALWEMGVRHLRVPAADLDSPERRVRLTTLSHLGFRFTLYSFGILTS